MKSVVKKGDKVSFSTQTGEGIITGIVNDEIVMVDMGDGFETPVLIKELIKISPENIQRFKDEIRNSLSFAKADAKKNNSSATLTIKDKDIKKPEKGIKKKHIAPEEVDLHINALVENLNGLSNADILRMQVTHFRNHLDKAISSGKRKIIFVHGVGEGVLKNEIRAISKSYENVTYFDASYQRYGYGATEFLINNS